MVYGNRFSRTSDLAYSRYNSSLILSVTNFSTPPPPQKITTADLFAGLEMIFGFDITYPNQPSVSSTNAELVRSLASTFSINSNLPALY